MSKSLAMTLGFLAVGVAVAMYVIGGDNGHLTELRDMFWVPLPLAAVFFILAFQQK